MIILFVFFLLHLIGAEKKLIWREEFSDCQYGTTFKGITKGNNGVFAVGFDWCSRGIIYKINSEGYHQWTTFIDAEFYIEFYAVSLDNSGNPWVAGISYGTITNENLDIETSESDSDSVLISFDDKNDGKPVRATIMGVAGKNSLASDVLVLDNQVVIAGSLSGLDVDHFENKPHCSGNGNSGYDNTDVYIAKYGTNHQFIKGCQFDFAGNDIVPVRFVWTGDYFYVAYYNDTVVNIAKLDKNIELVGSGYSWRTALDETYFHGVRSLGYFPFSGDILILGERAREEFTSHIAKYRERDMKKLWQKDFNGQGADGQLQVWSASGQGKKCYIAGVDNYNGDRFIYAVSGSNVQFDTLEFFTWESEVDEPYSSFIDSKGDLYIVGGGVGDTPAYILRYHVNDVSSGWGEIYFIGGGIIIAATIVFIFFIFWLTKKGGAGKMKHAYYDFTAKFSTNRWSDAQGATLAGSRGHKSHKSHKSHKKSHKSRSSNTVSSGNTFSSGASDLASSVSYGSSSIGSELSVGSAGEIPMSTMSQSPTMSLGSYDRSRSKSPHRKHKSRSHSRGSRGSGGSHGSHRSRSSGRKGASSKFSNPYQ